jgi:hypothetical protein
MHLSITETHVSIIGRLMAQQTTATLSQTITFTPLVKWHEPLLIENLRYDMNKNQVKY